MGTINIQIYYLHVSELVIHTLQHTHLQLVTRQQIFGKSAQIESLKLPYITLLHVLTSLIGGKFFMIKLSKTLFPILKSYQVNDSMKFWFMGMIQITLN